jgi:hypothetical protein
MRKNLKIFLIAASLLIFAPSLMSTITYSPSQPNVEQGVTFTVSHPDGISQSLVQWNFGDGTPPGWDTVSVVHTFMRRGTYTVSASYMTLKSQNVTDRVTLTVVERRKVTHSPMYPVVNRPVTFTAENFFSTVVNWDFGDGTQPTGGRTETHVYTIPGSYTVRAWDSAVVGQGLSFSTVVKVSTEEKGPRAAFQVYFIQLRFDDGKSYKIVGKNFEPLAVYADIKYEGTGILQVQWMLDGFSFGGVISKPLAFAKQTGIDSSEIMSLPTITPGIHEVSLKIIDPPAGYSVPAVRYFVALEEPKIERVNLSSTKFFGLDKTEIKVDKDRIEAPLEQYFVMRGSVKSEIKKELPFLLLRIYLDNKVVDQKLMENVKPGQEIEFETSIYNASPELKNIYLVFYDISEKPPTLLFIKKFILQGKGKNSRAQLLPSL